MKVLFIDDEPLIRRGLQVILPWKEYGFTEFFEAEDGQEGLEIIERENPELIMLDIQMERMSGLSLAQAVREKEYNGRMIILSGYSDFSYAKEAITYGVTAYLLKPVDPNLLAEAVEKALNELHKERLVSIYSEQPAHMSRNNILINLLQGSMTYTPDMKEIYHISLETPQLRLLSLYLSESGESPARTQCISRLEKSFLCAHPSKDSYVLILKDCNEEASAKQQLRSFFSDHPKDHGIMAVFSPKGESHKSLSILYNENEAVYRNLYYYKKPEDALLYAETLSRTSSEGNLLTLTEQLLQQILLLQEEELSQNCHSLWEYFCHRKPPRDTIGFALVSVEDIEPIARVFTILLS